MPVEKVCAYPPCGRIFRGTWGKQRFCSITCGRLFRTISTDEAVKQYFMDRVLISFESTCWIWQGMLNDAGYGMANVRGKRIRAHRLSYIIFVGPIPLDQHGKELDILHGALCIARACVNFEHLRPGTNVENSKDRVIFGHQLRGAQHYMAELTEVKVAHILRLRHEEGWTYKAIAKRYEVDHVTIHDIIKRKTWTHVLPGQFPAPTDDGRVTLTIHDVHAIRVLHSDGITYAELGRQFHVDQAHIRKICLRQVWRDLP